MAVAYDAELIDVVNAGQSAKSLDRPRMERHCKRVGRECRPSSSVRMPPSTSGSRNLFLTQCHRGATVLLLSAGIYGAWDLTLWMIKNREKT
jgi:hypothetical protein